MMRKFSKLLAVVMAIAIVICPAICLTSMAETPANSYSIAYDAANNKAIVTISSDTGFVAGIAKLSVAGYTVDTANIAVTDFAANTNDPENFRVVAHPYFNAGVLSLLITSADNADATLITSATVSIPVVKVEGTTDYGITLTNIQAADSGTWDEATGSFVAAEALIAFPYVNNAESGVIDPVAAAAAGLVLTVAGPCAHEGVEAGVRVEPTCDADGSITFTCTKCGETVVYGPEYDESLTKLDHLDDGVYQHNDTQHWTSCANGCGLQYNLGDHVYDDAADTTCNVCGYVRTVDTHTHEYTTPEQIAGDNVNHTLKCACGESITEAHTYGDWTVTTQPTIDAAGSKTRTCSVCGYTETQSININVNSAITVSYSGGLKATPYMTLSFTKSEISANWAGCSNFRLATTRNNNGGSYNFGTLATDITEVTLTTTKMIYYYYNVELYSLTVPIKTVLYYTDPNGNYCCSQLFETTMNETLKGLYDKAIINNKPALKTTIVDIVQAGSAVQAFVTDGKACDYANLALPNAAITSGNPIWSTEALACATQSLNPLKSYVSDGSANGITISKSAGVNSNPYLAFSVAGIAEANRSNYNVELSYYNAIDKATVTKTYSLGAEASNDVTPTSTKVWLYIRDLPMVSTSAGVTVKVYAVADPANILATYNYCFDDYITEKAITSPTNAKLTNALIALGKLGQSFRINNGIAD